MPAPMETAAATIGASNRHCTFHGDPVPPRRFSPEKREADRGRALEGIRVSRDRLDEIARIPGADRAGLLVARELLDHIEGSLRGAVLPADTDR